MGEVAVLNPDEIRFTQREVEVEVDQAVERRSGVGYRLSIAFQEFDVSTILAYALAFILIVQFIEFTVLQPLQARVNEWRR